MSDQNNPFAGLLGDSEQPSTNIRMKSDEEEDAETVNNIVQNVFHFTINQKSVEQREDIQLVFLDELAEALQPRVLIDLEVLEQALFERLLLQNVEKCVIQKVPGIIREHVVQQQVFPYLFSCIQNLDSYVKSSNNVINNAVQRMRQLIFRNAVTALQQPMLFEAQDFTQQLLELLQNADPQCQIFFVDVIDAYMSEENSESSFSQLQETIFSVLRKIHADVNKSNIINLPMYILPAIQVFAGNSHLASILMDMCEPKIKNNGRIYQDNVLGAILGVSVLSRDSATQQEFFENPMDQAESSLVEQTVWNATSHLTNSLYKIFLTMLKISTHMRKRVLSWIGNCLKANLARGKLWNVQSPQSGVSALNCVTDGFMLNLGAVLLYLCQPFCMTPCNPKALKIDPTYCAVLPTESEAKSVHLDCLHSETCLLPLHIASDDENGQPENRPTATTYNFVTECFFMTQKCLDLGFRVCSEKVWRYGQDLARAQRTLADVGNLDVPHLVEPMRQRAKSAMSKFLTYRCSLLESDMVSNLNRLQAMTCTWLTQVAVRTNDDFQDGFAPLEMKPVELPITTEPPHTLRCVPEFILENVVVVITMARRTAGAASGDVDMSGLLKAALTVVLMFMGDSSRTNNPHLRARLAECLEAMLPNHQPDEQQPLNSLTSFYREQLFKEHPHRHQLAPALLDVFVGIEMTGQSVQFEQKFNYRRPMYLVMNFLWTSEEHKEAFTRLAREAEANMEAVRPPLFLRFVNLLMNDAIFLLDEALGNMAQIRTMEATQESESWASLGRQEREQLLASLAHTGMLARFDNILGRETVRSLVRLTAHAPYVFCHPTLVERIASMLNYFLQHLVGPNKKNFKVKDMKEYEFEPASTVMDICRMYVQLGSNERFRAAVADDGRSYSPQLFTSAEAVLVRIGGGSLIGSLQEVASQVAQLAEKRQRDEEILANAPDEYLDPIMSTLMLDPVVLPSSRTTVDRTTIARHLLSDQSDPFNRSPLSMDQVKSNTELKEKIHAWIAEQKQKNEADNQ